MQLMVMPFVVAGILSLIFTPLVRKFNVKHGIMDIPKDERRVHNKPIPQAGGVAMYIAFVVSSLYFLELNSDTIGLLVGSTIIAGAGLYDDIHEISAKGKFGLQLIAAAILYISGTRIGFFTNPFYGSEQLIYLKLLAIPITLFWITGITNTINLIDGLDGLACGISLIAATSLMFIAYRYNNMQIAMTAAILAGACLGFLPYNFNPAKIFMGDTGALLLGFILSYISIEGVMKSAAMITIVIPIIILGVPIFDTTFAMLRRKLSGRSMVSADKGHLHHRLIHRGLSQKQTVLSLYAVSIVFGILANIVSRMTAQNAMIASLMIVAVVSVIALMIGLLKDKEC